MRRAEGIALPELLLAAGLLTLLGALTLGELSNLRARQGLESALRRVALGLELGRVAAMRQGRSCGLGLENDGWQPPPGGALPACEGVATGLAEGLDSPQVTLQHNLPAVVRFSSNGLILDGGTVLLATPGAVSRCLVLSPPLGVVRQGWLQGATCRPEETL